MNAIIEAYDCPGGGLTVAVKDCIDIAGRPTCLGSRSLADAAPAAAHAAVVQALVDGGCRIIAKTAMHELAYGVTGVNAWTGTVANPLYPGLISGGSSSGSAAAVAEGLVDIALGTDTGGSVRMPAACCGVIGFKPSFGRLSREGVSPSETSLDCVGLFAREMAPLERAMALMDADFIPREEIGVVAIALVETEAEAEIAGAVAAVVGSRGDAVTPIKLPLLDAAFDAGVAQIAAEAFAAYGSLLTTGLVGDDVAERLRAASAVATPEKLAAAERVRADFAAAVDAALANHDVLALPTLPVFPPRISDLVETSPVLRLTALVRPFNLSGHPAISVPVPAPSGRPAAMQLVARKGDDARLCAIARRFAAPAKMTRRECT